MLRLVVRRDGLRVGVLLVSAVVLGVYVPAPASSSCAGPGLDVPDAPLTRPLNQRELGEPFISELGEGETVTAVKVRRGEVFTVEGSYFLTGECDDTGGGSAGCARDDDGFSAPSEPAKDVELRLVQGDRSWSLGTSDATPQGSIMWNVTVPPGAAPGPGVLHAFGADFGVRVR